MTPSDIQRPTGLPRDPARRAEERCAIRAVPAARPDLLVFEINGRLQARDMHWMAEQVEAGFDRGDRIDILLVFRQFEGATAGAVFEPEALKAEAASVLKVRRYGVVGAPGWARAAIEMGGILSPIDARTFDEGQEAEARAWINAR
jgi:hypothetical protein